MKIQNDAVVGEKFGFDFREYAFYSALEMNDFAVKILGDEV